MALLAARRAAALLRPAAALPRPAAVLLRPARFSSSQDEYRAFVACLRNMSAAAKADKNYFGPASIRSFHDRVDSVRVSTHDGEVLRVIADVMSSMHQGLIEEVSNNFPFKIREKEGLTDITLTRSLKGEQIEVLVSMPKLDQDKEDDEDHSKSLSSSTENQEDEGETHPEEYSLPVRVTVSKADGSGLVFTCTANPDIVIESLSMRYKLLGAEEDSAATYDEGPNFRELDKNLQETLRKYLEVRGVTPTTTELLHKYMTTKNRRVLPKTASNDERNKLLFLTKLREFVKKD